MVGTALDIFCRSQVWQIGSPRKKSVVLFSIRLSPEVYAGTLTLSRLGVLTKKFWKKNKYSVAPFK